MVNTGRPNRHHHQPNHYTATKKIERERKKNASAHKRFIHFFPPTHPQKSANRGGWWGGTQDCWLQMPATYTDSSKLQSMMDGRNGITKPWDENGIDSAGNVKSSSLVISNLMICLIVALFFCVCGICFLYLKLNSTLVFCLFFCSL